MKKVININLSGRVISIEHNAWQTYLAYIETLHCYFNNEEDGFEIINDIENRIAELMHEILNKGGTCIKGNDMENIIRIIGTIDEFKELDTEDWDISIASPEHSGITNVISLIGPFSKLTENLPSQLEEFELRCN